MRWCRLYVETPSDPKLRRIAHQAGATMAHTLAVWVSMLAHAAANEGEAWGTLAGWDDLDCAINLGMDLPVVRAIRREMEQRLTIDNSILKWDARQSKGDHSAERMRQWRAKRSSQNQDVSDDVTSRSVTVTESDGKKRREENKEQSPSEPVTRVARAATRGHRLPEAWQPSPEDAGFADQLGLNPDAVAGSFRDYWKAQPGSKGVKTDWPATWRNWCRREAERAPRPKQAPGKLDWWINDMKTGAIGR
jgi:hypothetical protein